MEILSTTVDKIVEYGAIGTLASVLLIGYVAIISWAKNWVEKEMKNKGERILALERRMEDYEKGDRKEMIKVIEQNNQLFERLEDILAHLKQRV